MLYYKKRRDKIVMEKICIYTIGFQQDYKNYFTYMTKTYLHKIDHLNINTAMRICLFYFNNINFYILLYLLGLLFQNSLVSNAILCVQFLPLNLLHTRVLL